MLALTALLACTSYEYLPGYDTQYWNPESKSYSLYNQGVPLIPADTYEFNMPDFYEYSESYDARGFGISNGDVTLRYADFYYYSDAYEQYGYMGFNFETSKGDICDVALTRGAEHFASDYFYDSSVDWSFVREVGYNGNVNGDNYYNCWGDFDVKKSVNGLNDSF